MADHIVKLNKPSTTFTCRVWNTIYCFLNHMKNLGRTNLVSAKLATLSWGETNFSGGETTWGETDLGQTIVIPGLDVFLLSFTTSRRCSRNRSPICLSVSPMCNFLQRGQVISQVRVKWSVILMDRLGPNIISMLRMKGHVLHRARAHFKVPGWSLVGRLDNIIQQTTVSSG